MTLFRIIPIACVFAFATRGVSQRKTSAPTPLVQSQARSRRVVVGPTDIVPLHAQVGYTTMVVLPAGEEIIEATCGDKENWIVNGVQNFAYVKPAREGSRSNLNLLTKSGNIYTFLLSEGVPAGVEPDLKLFVESKDDSITAPKTMRFVSATEVDAVRKEAETSKRQVTDELQKVKEESERDKRRFRAEYPLRLEFYEYSTQKQSQCAEVKTIFTDGNFTYFKTTSSNVQSLREVEGTKLSLVNFEYRGDTYVVPKVLSSGTLRIGNHICSFHQGGRP